MNRFSQALYKPSVSIPFWLFFVGLNLYLNVFFQLFWLGLADEVFHYTVSAILAIFLTLLQGVFLPRFKPYLWGILPLLLLAIFWFLGVLSLLIEQSPLGNELRPLGWEGNLALLLNFFAYSAQIAILIRGIRAKEPESTTSML